MTVGIFRSAAVIVRSLVAHWRFAAAMAGRDLRARHKGALLGIAWLVIRPLFQVWVIVTVIAFVFKVRLGGGMDPTDYGLYVFSGLVAWQVLQRALEEAPSLIRDRMEIIKQIVYPVETLPVTTLLHDALAPAIGLAVYLALAAMVGQLSWSVVLLPLPAAVLFVLTLGASWLMMIVGIILKDLREIVSVVLGFLMYLSPVLLTEEMVGVQAWKWVLLNPFAHVIIAFRDVLTGAFHPLSWLIFAAMAAIAFVAGAWVISRAKTHINEYI